jgi:hypothetical protein
VKQIKSEKQENREGKAIIAALGFLLLGLVALWVTKSILEIEGDMVYVALLFVPILIYAIYSGKLEELKGPGGLEAKFTKAANESVNPASEEIAPSVEDMQIVEKAGMNLLEQKRKQLNEAQPIIMIMELGKGDYYRRDAVLAYLELLSQFRNFKFVVFVDSNKEFVAYMPTWAVSGLLRKPELGYEFIDVINSGDKTALFRYPGVIGETIRTQSTNVEALQEMTKQNLEALVVIDENKKLKGVVEREQILSRMMLSLAQ